MAMKLYISVFSYQEPIEHGGFPHISFLKDETELYNIIQ